MPVLTNRKFSPNQNYFSLASWAIPFSVAAFLILLSFTNFLFFHVLAEFFAILIGMLTFVVAWNMYPFTRNNYLMYLGSGYFWIAALDLIHTMAYEGMNIIPDGGANMSVQFWIGTRYLEAILLLTAPWFLSHSFNRMRGFIVYGIAACSITLLVYLGGFPESFIPGKGLTTFKVYSEYAIILILAIAIYYLYSQRTLLENKIVKVLIVSIILTMGAELAFTFYVSMYGLSNLVGHILKIFSFWLIFQAIIRTTLQEPFLVMSRGSSTYDVIPDATIVVDAAGVIHQVNNAACALVNKSTQEIVGNHHHDIFHDRTIKIESCPVCNASESNMELRGLETENTIRGKWFDFSLSQISGGTSLKGTVEVIRDITPRKITENKIAELNILKNSIVENLPSMLFVKNADDQRFVEWNKAAEEITGILKDDILGKNDLDLWPKEEAQFFMEKDKQVINSGQNIEVAEEPLTTKYKGVRILHTKKIPIYDEQGKAKYLLGISEDITETLKTEQMLRRSQKMEAVGQMSGGIAHDFNNQLGIIMGYAELLAEEKLTDSQSKWLDAVIIAAQRCADLTQQLMVFSRSGEPNKDIVDINTLITEMEAIVQRSITPEVTVNYYLTDNLWQTEVNVGEFKDAILNLILNAHDAMPAGGSLTIETTNIILDESNIKTFTNINEGEYVEVMVSDTGQGMSKEIYEHVFEPFFTTKDVGQGTGLGLAMVYGFVHRYGGDVLLETAANEGATFRIYLPRCGDTDSKSKNVSAKEMVSLKGEGNILIVDDEILLLGYTEELLKSWGYNVYVAKSPKEAIEILEKNNIDLLFSDVVMPGGTNGYELAEKAREINTKLNVLLSSGFTKKMDGNEKYEKYGFEFLAKPYKRDDLAKKLRLFFGG